MGASPRLLTSLALFPILAACSVPGNRRIPPPLSCTPQCDGRSCGEDGCGGVCGLCPDGVFCEPFTGRCAEGSGGSLAGRLVLQYRAARLLPSGGVELEDPDWLGAMGATLLVVSGDGDLLGGGEVTSHDGEFLLATRRPVQQGDRLVVTTWWAVRGIVVLAVLRPPPEEFQESTPLSPWSWVIETRGRADLGTISIREEDGAGALFLFLLSRRVQQSVLESVLSGDALPLVRLGVLWGPGLRFGCGACFAESLGFEIEGGPRMIQSILIDDELEPGGPWSWPVMLHEMGHYVARNYSRDNSPGGSHFLGQKLPPAFAWSEGWASFFGAMIATLWYGEPQPVYWDIQGDSSFWIDYSSGIVNGQRSVGPPIFAAGQNQDLDETWVTHFLWNLWEGGNPIVAAGGRADTAALLRAFSSWRMKNMDRAGAGTDLVDLLDALACNDREDLEGLTSFTREEMGFPWDGRPSCPTTLEAPSLSRRPAGEDAP